MMKTPAVIEEITMDTEHIVVVILDVLVPLALGWLIVRFIKGSRAHVASLPTRPASAEAELPESAARSGLGGWLALWVVGFALTPVTIPAAALQLWRTWHLVTFDTQDEFIWVCLTWLGASVLQVRAAIFFFRKDRRAPSTIVWLLVLGFVASLFFAQAAHMTLPAVLVLSVQFGSTVVWIRYFRRSKRVSATFVR